MKVLRLGINGLSKRLWLNIFMFIQLTIIILGVNILVANMNSRLILKKPFDYLLNKKGVIYEILPDDVDYLNYYKKIEKKLKGDFTVHRIYSRTEMIRRSSGKEILTDVYGFENEFYENMNLPLSAGSWKSLCSDDTKDIECVVTPNNYGIGLGSIIEIRNEKSSDGIDEIEIDKKKEKIRYKVVGVLSNPTYVPNYSASGNDCRGVFETYGISPYTNNRDGNLIVYANGDKLLQYTGTNVEPTEYITYNTNVPDELEKYNNTIMVKHGDVVSISKFKKLSEKYVNKLKKRVMPIFIGAVFIMIIGVISTSMIQLMSQMREFGVYYLCGATRMQCVLLSISSNLITYIMAIILSVGTLLIINYSSLGIKLGTVFGSNNVIITMVFFASMCLVAVIAPIIVLKVGSIKNILIENRQ